ncbi:MAG TPA: Flp pilus assembly protein CpaB [Xanthobacteraceae bacterium]|nr:Flp pilus assembly protein CpaB [Xanthobacteraceae bacterium]
MKPARIIVLFIAVAAGGVAALLAGRSDQAPPPPAAPVAQLETAEVLVANTEIGMGSSVSNQDLRWQTWPAAAASANFIRKNERPDAITQLAGSIARAPFSDGEPIREAKLIHANGSGYMAAILPTGMRAVSTDISPETGAGGFILPNDHVDVILTRRDRDAEQANGGIEAHVAETILTNVRVLAIDQTVEEKNGQRVVVGKTATLELSSQLAERLTLAHQLGTLSLALRSLVDSGMQQEAEAKPALRSDSITIFRGGAVEAYTCTPNCDHRVIPGGSASDFSAAPATPVPTPLPPK